MCLIIESVLDFSEAMKTLFSKSAKNILAASSGCWDSQSCTRFRFSFHRGTASFVDWCVLFSLFCTFFLFQPTTTYLHGHQPSTTQPLRAHIFTSTWQPDYLDSIPKSAILSHHTRLLVPYQIKICSQQNDRHFRPRPRIHDIDVVAITETWLCNKDSDLPVTRALTLPGCNLNQYPRPSRRCGGIVILHKYSIKAKAVKTFNDIRSFETMSAKLITWDKYNLVCLLWTTTS